jgi:hypothetical protein
MNEKQQQHENVMHWLLVLGVRAQSEGNVQNAIVAGDLLTDSIVTYAHKYGKVRR